MCNTSCHPGFAVTNVTMWGSMSGQAPPIASQVGLLHEPQCEWRYGGKVRHPEFHPPLTLQNQGLGGMSGCEIHAGCCLGLVSFSSTEWTIAAASRWSPWHSLVPASTILFSLFKVRKMRSRRKGRETESGTWEVKGLTMTLPLRKTSTSQTFQTLLKLRFSV